MTKRVPGSPSGAFNAKAVKVIQEYKAKGPVTETLLSVVALDDAVSLIAFGFSITIAKVITTGQGSLGMAILEPFIEVGCSILFGMLIGYLMKFPIQWFTQKGGRLSIIIAIVAITVSGADMLGLSNLLSCMAMGATFANVYYDSDYIMKVGDRITYPLYMLFFVVSGAELDLSVLSTVGLMGGIYIIFRVVGKIFGAYLAGNIMKAPPTVKKYLGVTLIPQEGVAIALALLAAEVVPDYANQIKAIVLGASLIYGLFGPALSKYSLEKAGEIN